MIEYLFGTWLGGFVLILVVQLGLRGGHSLLSLREAAQIIGLSALWPPLLIIGVICAAADGLHFLIQVARKPH